MKKLVALILAVMMLIGYVPEDRHVLLASGAQKPLILSKNSSALEAFQRIAGRIDGESIPIPF